MSYGPEPIEVVIKRAAREVVVRWSDAHVTVLPFWYLRGFCPCAQCQGHSGGWEFVSEASLGLVGIEEVGQYALNAIWDDGHRTGIYTFEALRELCPCVTCVAARGPRHPVQRVPANVIDAIQAQRT